MRKFIKLTLVLSVVFSFTITLLLFISDKMNSVEGAENLYASSLETKYSNEQEEKAVISYESIKVTKFQTIQELLVQLEETNIPIDDFVSIMNNEENYKSFQEHFDFLPPYQEDTLYLLEGYLLPGEYRYKEGNLYDLLKTMLFNTNNWLTNLTDNYNHHLLDDYTISDLIILSSIVEKESAKYEDRQNIAGVFFNRLNKGMPLQSDVTAMYVRNLDSVNASDVRVKSSYNTYHVDGLPIGPINTPSEDSLKAVLNYTNNDYLFFIGTGLDTLFSSTFDEHKQLIAFHLK